MVSISTRSEFGDYQCNAALPLAKHLGLKPHEVANRLKEALSVDDILVKMDIAGPGFINMHLSDSYVNTRLSEMLTSPIQERLGIPEVETKQRIVVDFSSPNIAKEMHVGHLRSTIIGDTISRVLSFLGHDVVRLNHVGDWGTQFGMLIHYLKENHNDFFDESNEMRYGVGELVEFYRASKKRFDEDSHFKDAARREVVALQGGNTNSLKAWQKICEISRFEFQAIYDRLNIDVNERGESFYNSILDDVVTHFNKTGLLHESEGAKCIFLDGYVNKDGSPLPLIIQKSDGAFLYATTDLAAIKQRAGRDRESGQEAADRIIYVTDVGQSQHFEMVFKAAKKAGFASLTELTHVPFGLVQGEDGKKFKTRSGDTIKLKELLDEAVSRATMDFTERNKGEKLTPEQINNANIVGLAAVKYADLSMNRESSYRFSFSKMLSLNGNTAPYMLYSFVRIMGIQRKALELGQVSNSNIHLNSSEERELAVQLIRFGEVLVEVEKGLYPNKICDYLFELSQRFNKFYEKCPVNQAETEELRLSRIALCSLTANTIKLGLEFLGIETVSKL